MSGDNVGVVRRVLDAIRRRDLPCLLELTDPDVEWRSLFAFGTGVPYAGHEGMRQYVRDLNDAWEDLHVEVEGLLDAGGVVIGVGRIHCRGGGSGVESESAAGWLFKFRDGRGLVFGAFRDPEQTLEAAGLAS